MYAVKSSNSFFLAALLALLPGCGERNPVTIAPGTFGEAWPSALRGELIKNTRCSVDVINGLSPREQSIAVKSGEPLTLSGWVYSKKDGVLPEVYVQLVGPAITYTAIAQRRTARPDVNQHFQLAADWNPGFELEASQTAEPAEYELVVLQPGKEDVAQCHTKRVIRIDPPAASGT